MNERRDNQRQKKTFVDHKNNIEWLLNLIGGFTPDELSVSAMREMESELINRIYSEQCLLQCDATTYLYDNSKFGQKRFKLYPNVIILEEKDDKKAFYLILSNCFLTKKVLSYKENQAFGLILNDHYGTLILFFDQYVTQRDWYKRVKQYCRFENFNRKIDVVSTINSQLFLCKKRKKSQQYLCQIIDHQKWKYQKDAQETLDYYIQILRTFTHNSIPKLERVYYQNQFQILMYDLLNVVPLNISHSNSFFNDELKKATLIFQLLKIVRFLQKNGLYHGNINPSNILIQTTQTGLQIYSINYIYKEKPFSSINIPITDLGLQLNFIAPEVKKNCVSSISGDIYSIGIILYYLQFVQPSQSQNSFDFSPPQIENYKALILKTPVSQQSSLGYSQSMLDFLTKTTHPDPGKRFTCQEALKHQWFLNTNTKIKTKAKIHENKNSPVANYLNTIMELKSQSDLQSVGSLMKVGGRGIRYSIASYDGIQKSSELNQYHNSQDAILEEDYNEFIGMSMWQYMQGINQICYRPSRNNRLMHTNL